MLRHGQMKFSKEDISNLKKYVEKSRNFHLEEWSSEDIDNFVNLADIVVKERSEDKGAWYILIIAKTIQVLKIYNPIENQI